MKRTELKRGTTPIKRKAALVGSRARANGIGVPRRAVSPASPAQRAKARDGVCVVCGRDRYMATLHPAHLIDRSLTSVGQEDSLAIVPLCAEHHHDYDERGLDLLPHLEPAWRAELAFAVARVGLVTTYRRVANTRQALE